MSGAPSGKPQSEKELKTTRTLNTIATIGAGHALYAMTPEAKREAAREKLLKLTPEKTRPATRKLLATLKQPELGGKLTTAGKVVAGGWLGLHSAELAGDVMARRSINNQLAQVQAQKNKGSVGSVKKNDMSMISKAEGSVSRNGHGKGISDSEKRAAVVGGTFGGSVIGGTAGSFVTKPKSKLKKDPGNEKLPKGMKSTGSPLMDRMLKEQMDPIERAAHKRDKMAYERMNNQFEGIVEHNKLKPSKMVRAKLAGHKLSSNRYVVGGTALGGGAVGGLEYLNQKSKSVNKADRSEWSEGRKTRAKHSNQRLIAGGLGASIPVAGAWGPAAAGAYSSTQAKKGKKLDAGNRVFLRSLGTSAVGSTPGVALMAAGVKHKNPGLAAVGVPIGMIGATVGGAHGAATAMRNAQKRGDINKAYRRFDPEADRQRRLGLYAGTGVGGSIVAGREAARNFETKVVSGSGAKATTHRGLYAKPGKGKKGLGLAAVAAASGALGVGSYKRGISQRNQPWT